MVDEFVLPNSLGFDRPKHGLKGGDSSRIPSLLSTAPAMKDEGFTPTPPPNFRDIGLSAASAFPREFGASTVGFLGDVQELAPKVGPFLARQAGEVYGYLTGQPNPIEAMQKKYETESKEMMGRLSPREQELARTSKRLEQPARYPTSQDIREGMKPMTVAGYPVGEFLTRKPETPEGEAAGRIAGLAGTVASPIGGVSGMGRRAVEGGVGGYLGDLYASSRPNSPETPVATVALELVGMGATNAAGKFLRGAETRGAEQLSSILREAYDQGKIKYTPEQIIAAQKAGIPISFADVADPKTRAALQEYAGVSDRAGAMGDYNRTIATLAEPQPFIESQQRIKGMLEGLIETTQGTRITPSFGPSPSTTFKPSLDPVEISTRIAAESKGEVDRVYNLARSNPAAQNIPASSFDSTLIAAPAFKTAFDEAATTAANRNVGKSISDPDYVKVPYIDKNTGQEVAGNLPFWDLVKRRVDQTISKSIRDGSDADLADAMRIKDSLLKGLDPIVPEYGAARSFASEAFGAAESPMAGYNAYKDSKNLINRTQAANAFRSAPKIEQEGIRQGWLSGLNDDIQSGKLDGIVTRLQKDQNFKDTGRLFLGDEKFDALSSNLLAEGLRNKAKEMTAPIQRAPTVMQKAGPAAAGVAALAGIGSIVNQALGEVIQFSFFKPELMVPAAGVAVGTYAGKKISQARLKAMADRMIPMFTSTNPAVTEQLAKLIKDVPEAQALAEATWKRITAAESGVEEYDAQQEREGRATGGRTVKDPMKNAASLIALANKIKNEQSQGTSSLLNLDDATVAKALAVANKHI